MYFRWADVHIKFLFSQVKGMKRPQLSDAHAQRGRELDTTAAWAPNYVTSVCDILNYLLWAEF